MKKLNNLPNGGFRTFSDDLRFMTEINKDAFEMLTAALSDLHSVIILKGCDISTTGSNTVVTPGVILMHNELLAFNGLTFPTPTGGDVAYWSTEDVVLKSRAFQAGNMEDVHIDKVARIEVGGSVPSGSLAIDDTKRYWEVVNDKVIHPDPPIVFESQHITSFPTMIPLASDPNSHHYVMRINKRGLVELDFKNNTTTARVASFDKTIEYGGCFYLKSTQNPSDTFNFSLSLNSSYLSSGIPKIIKKGITGVNANYVLEANKTHLVLRTSDGWELFDM